MRQALVRFLLAGALAAPAADARTYTVGPPGSGREFTQLRDLFEGRDLAPGDIVLVDGNATYSSFIVREDDGGAAANPVVIRWNRNAGSSRPRIEGGSHTVKFERSNHVLFEGFEVTGGTSTCVFNEAHDVTVRDAVVHGCPSHGILGADQNSGSFTLEYSEVYDAGAGTTRHALYMQSDEVAYPDAVLRIRFNYVHSGNGGNLLKSRHRRSEIHYNWFEGAVYQEMELIGPDCETQQPGWSPTLRREDAELVGNVIVHTSSWRNAIRAGGDLNGRSMGRVRMLNNTIVFDRSGTANAVLVQLGLQSLEMHNNVIYQTGSGAPAIVAENPAADVATPYCAPFEREPWVEGRRVHGTHNWVESVATRVPPEWTGTRTGADPLFVDLVQRRLRPRAGSPLIDAGHHAPPAFPGYEFPSPTARAVFDPPLRARVAPGAQRQRLLMAANIDIGALEEIDIADYLVPRNGARPLIPPPELTGSGRSAVGTGPVRGTRPAPPRKPELRRDRR